MPRIAFAPCLEEFACRCGWSRAVLVMSTPWVADGPVEDSAESGRGRTSLDSGMQRSEGEDSLPRAPGLVAFDPHSPGALSPDSGIPALWSCGVALVERQEEKGRHANPEAAQRSGGTGRPRPARAAALRGAAGLAAAPERGVLPERCARRRAARGLRPVVDRTPNASSRPGRSAASHLWRPHPPPPRPSAPWIPRRWRVHRG